MAITHIRNAGIRVLLDIRFNNTSQLAAFSRSPDLAYFLHELVDAGYEHRVDLAPTADMLKAYEGCRGAPPHSFAARRPPTAATAAWSPSTWRARWDHTPCTRDSIAGCASM